MAKKDSSIFDPKAQIGNIDAKMVVALERISEVFRVSLWGVGKEHGLSPLQIQILIFVNFHGPDKSKVSYLAQELSLSKPTISEAVRTLEKKQLIEKETDPVDTRSYSIFLTPTGRQLVGQVSLFANDLQQAFENWSSDRKSYFLLELLQLIFKLQKLGFISMQRMCFRCRYFKKQNGGYFCDFLKMPLREQDLRVDCEEFEEG